jgi:hypothetical protein
LIKGLALLKNLFYGKRILISYFLKKWYRNTETMKIKEFDERILTIKSDDTEVRGKEEQQNSFPSHLSIKPRFPIVCRIHFPF